ncbi:MAG TPA: hypothetical protein VLV83_00845 [Acidobacteriota bacterium]|nr:hypothetical protein [Acidobacteriota bacterium]
MQTGHPQVPARDDIERLRFVTENYTQIQGLRLVPFGLFFLAKGLGGEAFTDKWVLFPSLLAAFLLFFLIGRYYESRFGRVRRKTSCLVKDALAAGLTLILITAGVQLENSYDLPFNLVALVVGGLFFYIHLHSVGRRSHYGWLALLFVLLGLLPATGWVTAEQIFAPQPTIGDFMLAGAYILGGVLDHRMLARSFPPDPDEESDDDAF